MPCNSDYLAPTHREREQQRAAKLLQWLYTYMKLEVPNWVEQAAGSCYGTTDAVVILCRDMRALTPEFRQEVLSQQNRYSRDLANWWEEHLAADAAREKREAARDQAKLRQAALRKLTWEERKALGW